MDSDDREYSHPHTTKHWRNAMGETTSGTDTGTRSHNVDLYDRLDFEAWNRKDWELFRQLHTDDVKVVSGSSESSGIDAHVEAMRALLEASDSHVDSHDIAFGCGEWTCGIATATNECPNGSERTLICTVARWRDGRIAEEYLFTSPAPSSWPPA
jgi:hypothetical protein